MGMTDVKQEVIAFFKAVSNAEDSVLGFLTDPSTIPLPYDSFLNDIELPLLIRNLYKRRSMNPSYFEAMTSDVLFRKHAFNRDMATRKLTRKEYYSYSNIEYAEEKIRLDRAKIDVVQAISGNTVFQSSRIS